MASKFKTRLFINGRPATATEKVMIASKIILALGFLCLVVALISSGCGPVHQVLDPNAGDPDDCQAACANMAAHACPGYRGYKGDDGVFGTEDDIGCVDICIRVTEAGIGLEQACVATASTCEEMERCQNVD